MTEFDRYVEIQNRMADRLTGCPDREVIMNLLLQVLVDVAQEEVRVLEAALQSRTLQ
jgi:hypothetical protein